jgi:alpha,alpha-trehalase
LGAAAAAIAAATRGEWRNGQVRSWRFRYTDYDPPSEKLRETLCTVGNGYFATRGAAPESTADSIHYPGTYIAGCYDQLESSIDGRKVQNESLVNVPNWLPLTFRAGDEREWFDLAKMKVLEYVEELDVRRGIMIRNVLFEDGQGRVTRLAQRRFAHMSLPHLGGLETALTAENWSGRVTFLSALDGRVTNSGVAAYRQFNGVHLVPEQDDAESATQPDTVHLSVRTIESKIRIAEAARTRVFRNGREVQPPRRTIRRPAYVGQQFSVTLERGDPLSVEKVAALYTSRDRAIFEPVYAAKQAVAEAPAFADLIASQEVSWNHLWRRFRILVEGDDKAALATRIHNFHLLQTASPNSIDLDVGLPARGLHGEGYRGHVFWDELFVFPLLNIHVPDLTRSLLMYRYRRLPGAKRIALSEGFRGALYPWESASDGSDVTPALQFDPVSNRWLPINTNLQWHIDSAIAYNIWAYFQVSHDSDFLSYYGAEMLLEVARFYGSIARRNESTGRYEIRGVMGPDEYHVSYPGSRELGLNNNAYTNVMVVWTLLRALDVLDLIPKSRRDALCESLDLGKSELELWEDISRRMFVPFHREDGMISQFEGYEGLKEFNWEEYKKKHKNIQRIDSLLEAEGDSANNYKICKQADTVMLFYLFSYEELEELFARMGYKLRPEDVQKNTEYYLKRTSHGSTLSRIVYSWVLARLNREESWQIAKEALESDLSDIQGGTTPEGIHLGAMAGTVEIIQRCYAGLVTRNGVLSVDPCLPKELEKLEFTVYYGGHIFDFSVSHTTLTMVSHPGPASPVKIRFRGETCEMIAGDSRSFSLSRF